MNQDTSHFVKIDVDAKRRNALAKVYSLLIRLADEAEKRARPSETNPNEEKVVETTSVPLQQNIPRAEV